MAGDRTLTFDKTRPGLAASRRWAPLAAMVLVAIVVAGVIGYTTSRPGSRGQRTDGPTAVWWSPQLGIASRDAAVVELGRPFMVAIPVSRVLADGSMKRAEITNCNSYFELRAQAWVGAKDEAGDDAQARAAIWESGARCHALRLLQRAARARRTLLPPALGAPEVMDQLPPVLGPEPSPKTHESRAQSTADGLSWRRVDPDARVQVTGARTAVIHGYGWTTDLDELVRGDFDGDGFEDVLVRTSSRGPRGTAWRDVRVLVLTRTHADRRVISVVDSPVL